MTHPDPVAAAREHYQAGRLHEAEQLCRQIVSQSPDNTRAWHFLGVIAYRQGDFQHAVCCSQQALKLRPDYAEAHYNLGLALHAQGDLAAAAASYQRALAIHPGFAEAHNNLGNIFKAQRQWSDAVACYRRALQSKPDFAEAHTNLGDALKELGQIDEAIASSQRAIELNPHLAEAHNNLGSALEKRGSYHAAAAAYQRALQLNPNYADAHWNHALLMLLIGDYEQGWQEYEWRWRCAWERPRKFKQPRWEGEDLTGKTILLYAEDGIGDTFQFIRYAGLVAQVAAKVIVECQKPLANLLQGSFDYQIIPHGNDLPPFDVQAPFMALPRIFRTKTETIPASAPYLHASPELISYWRERLRHLTGVRIGIAWQGDPANYQGRLRNIPLMHFRAIAELPDVHLISLQKGVGREPLAHVNQYFPILDLENDLDEEHGAFMDSAAIIRTVDLVISSDTSVAHLAGALGAPVWVALERFPEWRWLLDRTDSPWYPTMRLFRQQRAADWSEVFNRIKFALSELITARKQGW